MDSYKRPLIPPHQKEEKKKKKKKKKKTGGEGIPIFKIQIKNYWLHIKTNKNFVEGSFFIWIV